MKGGSIEKEEDKVFSQTKENKANFVRIIKKLFNNTFRNPLTTKYSILPPWLCSGIWFLIKWAFLDPYLKVSEPYFQIRSERASEAYFSERREKCQCQKAKDIVEECTSIKHDLSLILEVCKAIFHYSRDMIIINFIRVRLRISDVIHKILSQDWWQSWMNSESLYVQISLFR